MSNTISNDSQRGSDVVAKMINSGFVKRSIKKVINADTIVQLLLNYAIDSAIDYGRNKFTELYGKKTFTIMIFDTWEFSVRHCYHNAVIWFDTHRDAIPSVTATRGHADTDIALSPTIGTNCIIPYQGVSISVSTGRDEHQKYISFTVDVRHKQVLEDLFNSWKYVKPNIDMIPIYTYDEKEKSWSITNYKRKRPLESVVLPEHVKTKLIKRTLDWKNNRQWYYDNYIMWKQNNLLHGPGGTGKSTLILVLATLLGDYGIAKLPIRGMTNDMFIDAVNTLPKNVVVAIEDGDTTKSFAKRKGYTDTKSADRLSENNPTPPITPGNALSARSDTTDTTLTDMLGSEGYGAFGPSMDTILNVLQGLDTPDGLFSVITSNDPNFDHAILRDGRMDVVVYLGDMMDKEIRDYIHLKYPTYTIPKGMVFGPIKGATIEDLFMQTIKNPKEFVRRVHEKSTAGTVFTRNK